MNEKKKKHTSNTSSMGNLPFVLLWMLTYGFGWAGVFGGGWLQNGFFPLFELPTFLLALLLGGIPGFLSSGFQQFLMRRKFSVSIPQWWMWSTLASFTAGGALYVYFEFFEGIVSRLVNHNLMLEVSLVLGVIFSIPAIAQAFLLRGRVKHVWLWVLAAFVSAATYALPWVNTSASSGFIWMLIFGLAGLLQGSVMGLSLAWLFGMTRTPASENSRESERVQHAAAKLAYHTNTESVVDQLQIDIALKQQK